MTDLSILSNLPKTLLKLSSNIPPTGDALMNDDGTEMSVTVHAPYTKAVPLRWFLLLLSVV
jgi:hypothetical protein